MSSGILIRKYRLKISNGLLNLSFLPGMLGTYFTFFSKTFINIYHINFHGFLSFSYCYEIAFCHFLLNEYWIGFTYVSVYLLAVFQRTIYLHCFGLSNNSAARDYWWGIELYNATYSQWVDGVSAINESATILQNVDIMYAGVSPKLDPVPAVRASPTVPSLINVTIMHSALDATNYTEVMSSATIYNTSISNSRGTVLLYFQL